MNDYKIYRNNLNEDLYYLEIDDLLKYISISVPKDRTQKSDNQIFDLKDFTLSKGEKYLIEDAETTQNFVFTLDDLDKIRNLIQSNYKNISIDETKEIIESFDKTKELSIYTKERIELNFNHNSKIEHEKIKLGESINVENVDYNSLSYNDIKLLDKIKKNDFFKALSNNNVNNIVFSKSEKETFINIPTQQGNILFTEEQVNKFLEKYPTEENDFIYRPKESNLVLAV